MTLVPILLVSSFLAANPLAPGDHTRTLQHDGRSRSYLAHVPPKHDAKRPTLVVLVFHGAVTDASITVRFTGLNETADREGFIAVYPNGTGHFERMLTWNGGNCCGYAQWNKVDDEILFTISGGGHTWPGQDPKAQFLGKSTKNISANDLMWEFFQRHPLPDAQAILPVNNPKP